MNVVSKMCLRFLLSICVVCGLFANNTFAQEEPIGEIIATGIINPLDLIFDIARDSLWVVEGRVGEAPQSSSTPTRIVNYSQDGNDDNAIDLHSFIDVQFGPYGNLYGIQYGVQHENSSAPKTGALVQISEGEIKPIFSGFNHPTALIFNSEGDAFITLASGVDSEYMILKIKREQITETYNILYPPLRPVSEKGPVGPGAGNAKPGGN